MKMKNRGVHRRSANSRKLWDSVGAVLAHVLAGSVMLLALVALEVVTLLAIQWLTGLVHERWFSLTARGMDLIFLSVDVLIVLYWLVSYGLRSAKEIDDE